MVWREDGFLRWVRRYSEYTTDYEPEQRVLSQSPDWEETTAISDPPGVRTFRRLVTADIDNDGAVHVIEQRPRQYYSMSGLMEKLKSTRILGPLIAFTGEYCDQ